MVQLIVGKRSEILFRSNCMNRLGISIIIPCYNAGNFLAEAVESILVQPFFYPFEIVIVDDGSNDKQTPLVLQSLQGMNNIKIISHSENMGVQSARNDGLRSASFNFILPFDADDRLNTDPKILKEGTYADRAINILSSSPDVAFVHAMTYMFGDFSGFTISAYPLKASLILEKHHVPTAIIYRKEDALNAGLYDESILKWQDWSFAVGILNSRYLSKKKNTIKFLQFPYLLYRIHSQINRVSLRDVCEKEMVRRTFLRYPEIFRNYYGNTSDLDIIDIVLSKKPDRLIDLLYVASNDINTALEIVSQRALRLAAGKELSGIP